MPCPPRQTPSYCQAAAARLSKERERLAAQEAEQARVEAAEPQASAPAAAVPASGPAARAGKDSASECQRLWQEYFQSEECFAPYFTVHGIKAEAFEHCKEMVNPYQQCGPAKESGTK